MIRDISCVDRRLVVPEINDGDVWTVTYMYFYHEKDVMDQAKPFIKLETWTNLDIAELWKAINATKRIHKTIYGFQTKLLHDIKAQWSWSRASEWDSKDRRRWFEWLKETYGRRRPCLSFLCGKGNNFSNARECEDKMRTKRSKTNAEANGK